MSAKSPNSGRLFILTGPSCIGKTPLVKALGLLFPETAARLQKLILYNDRQPRPGEMDGKDYHFRTRQQIEALGLSGKLILIPMRSDLHGLNIQELQIMLGKGDVLYEGNPYVSRTLVNNPKLAHIKHTSIFLSPLSKEEILFFKNPELQVSLPYLIDEIMRSKLVRRTKSQKGDLTSADLEDIDIRASAAFQEMQMAHKFDYILPNHNGEDSEHWSLFRFPIGDARKAVLAFNALINGKNSPWLEVWDQDLLS